MLMDGGRTLSGSTTITWSDRFNDVIHDLMLIKAHLSASTLSLRLLPVLAKLALIFEVCIFGSLYALPMALVSEPLAFVAAGKGKMLFGKCYPNVRR